jgi:hypothetical protein
MHITLANKLFLQLAPDPQGIAVLQAMQRRLQPGNGMELVAANELHLSILHIGPLARFAGSIKSDLAKEVVLSNIQAMAAAFMVMAEEAATARISLVPTSTARFGTDSGVYALEFSADGLLNGMHARALLALRLCLLSCGIEDPDAYIAHTPHLQHAPAFRPHVAIAHNYHGPELSVPSTDMMRFVPAPTVV